MKQQAVNDQYIGYVYKITNKINGKNYIGETINTIEKRFYQHSKDAYNETYKHYYFYRAIRKYGIENFEISILEEIVGIDKKEIKALILNLEEKYISTYDSFKNGYNSNSGGRHPVEVSAETKELQRKIKLENPKTKENLIKARSFQHPEKEVTAYNYETGEIINTFNSIKEAADFYKVDSSGITKVCKGKTNYLGNIKNTKITWRYKGDPYSIPYKIKVYNEDGILLNKFINFTEGAKYYNIAHQETITRCCNRKTKCTGRGKGNKLIWRFINDNF